MPIHINSPGWRVRSTSRGAPRDATQLALPGVPPEFLTTHSSVAEEVVLDPPSATRGRDAAAASTLDLSYDLPPGQTAVLAIRHPSGALTFHQPVQATTRGVRGPSEVRFQVHLRQPPATRGLGGRA